MARRFATVAPFFVCTFEARARTYPAPTMRRDHLAFHPLRAAAMAFRQLLRLPAALLRPSRSGCGWFRFRRAPSKSAAAPAAPSSRSPSSTRKCCTAGQGQSGPGVPLPVLRSATSVQRGAGKGRALKDKEGEANTLFSVGSVYHVTGSRKKRWSLSASLPMFQQWATRAAKPVR
jgi:hypothetical protein